MSIASFILSIVSVVLGVVSIYITLKLTKRTSELREEIRIKYDNSRAAARFNEKKLENIDKINNIKKQIIENIDQEPSLEALDELYLTIKRIQKNLLLLKGKEVEEAKKTVEGLKSALEYTEFGSQEKNKIILEYLRDIIIFLESYEYIE